MSATNTFAWIITVGLWILALIVGSCALTACGDSPFAYDPTAAGDSGWAAEADPPDATPDDGGRQEAQPLPKRDAGPPPEVDAGPDAAPVDADPDASPETDASDIADAGCAPSPTQVGDCNGVAFTMPDQYCALVNNTPTIMTTPAECRCAGRYTCACLFATPGPWCPPGSSYDTAGCGLQTNGKLVCEQGDGG